MGIIKCEKVSHLIIPYNGINRYKIQMVMKKVNKYDENIILHFFIIDLNKENNE